jgi:hypothetical protein
VKVKFLSILGNECIDGHTFSNRNERPNRLSKINEDSFALIYENNLDIASDIAGDLSVNIFISTSFIKLKQSEPFVNRKCLSENATKLLIQCTRLSTFTVLVNFKSLSMISNIAILNVREQRGILRILEY